MLGANNCLSSQSAFAYLLYTRMREFSLDEFSSQRTVPNWLWDRDHVGNIIVFWRGVARCLRAEGKGRLVFNGGLRNHEKQLSIVIGKCRSGTCRGFEAVVVSIAEKSRPADRSRERWNACIVQRLYASTRSVRGDPSSCVALRQSEIFVRYLPCKHWYIIDNGF